MSLIADVFVTTKGRDALFQRSLRSFARCTDPATYRLTVVDDTGADEVGCDMAQDAYPRIDRAIVHRENIGLGPSINEALALIDAGNRWHSDAMAPDPSRVAPFVCYAQDDVLYTPGWLETLAKWFTVLEQPMKVGFATGIECPEHSAKARLSNGILVKEWIRATCMFARREYWMSMWPITRFDPETCRVRARPHDGVGSGVDWHFIRNHENSVCRTGRVCIVVPGLLRHMGYRESTWLRRELPETDGDKAAIAEEMSGEERP